MRMPIQRREFSERLLEWWEKNQRKFPWRKSHDPYSVLISEILLHRTRADQVVPVYTEFIKRFQTIEDLANAPLDQVKKVVHSLGLHWRTKYMHQMAREIAARFGGEIPLERENLESLPGISHYIVSALRCFAHGYPEAILDTNTVRILGRVFGTGVTDGSRRSRKFKDLYLSILEKEHPREFNYAMIDLGALICIPGEPLCHICPVRKMCMYGRSKIGEA
jgi:A/G-specific adenine glycosylase